MTGDSTLDGGTAPQVFDPRTAAFARDPFPFYQHLRANSPVHFVESTGMWWVTRYADAAAVLMDKRFGTEPVGTTAEHPHPSAQERPPGMPETPPNMVERNPPDHTRIRGLFNKAFTPKVVERLRPHIEQITAQLLDQAEARAELDIVRDLAFPLPALMIAELLGVPAEDRVRFKIWSQRITLGMDSTQPQQVLQRARSAEMAFGQYMMDLIAERRRAPQPDLISELIAVEQAGERLSAAELLSNASFLLIAGHVTTTNLIGNGMLALLEHPAQLQALRANRSLLPTAIEELLRFAGPIHRIGRNAMEDVVVGDQLIRKGERVIVVLAAANRDPAVFANPETLDLSRAENPHLAFGRGIHFCMGAPLARLEAQIAFSAMLDRFPRLELAEPEPDWGTNTVIRGLKTLRVKV